LEVKPRRTARPILRQTPEAAFDVEEQAGITQDLELLADFIFDVAIIGMEFFQFAGEGVGVGGRKFSFAEAADI